MDFLFISLLFSQGNHQDLCCLVLSSLFHLFLFFIIFCWGFIFIYFCLILGLIFVSPLFKLIIFCCFQAFLLHFMILFLFLKDFYYFSYLFISISTFIELELEFVLELENLLSVYLFLSIISMVHLLFILIIQKLTYLSISILKFQAPFYFFIVTFQVKALVIFCQFSIATSISTSTFLSTFLFIYLFAIFIYYCYLLVSLQSIFTQLIEFMVALQYFYHFFSILYQFCSNFTDFYYHHFYFSQFQ